MKAFVKRLTWSVTFFVGLSLYTQWHDDYWARVTGIFIMAVFLQIAAAKMWPYEDPE